MSHFLFVVSRNTQLNKAAIGCPFHLNQHKYLSTQWSSFFGDLFVVLFVDLLAPLDGVSFGDYVVLYTIYNDVWRHLTTSNTIYNKFNVARDRSI